MNAVPQVYPRAGEEIGPFRITRRLGGGGMGVVYAATQQGLGREVALQVISPHLADDRDFRVRFAREARAMAALDSAHVVHVYTFGEDDGRLYIASQLIPDGDLDTVLRTRGAPPLGLALELMAQVASGLADAHGAGLVHRDIKPANVLLRERADGHVAYLGDFGIARNEDADPTSTSHTVGTPSYMAPELHLGAGAGVASDIYSLGCLLWATRSGAPPYGGTSDFQIVTAHLDRPVPQLEGSSPQVQQVNAILRTAMAKQPEDRYPSATAMRDHLRYALAQPGPAASVATPAPPRPVRRRGAGVLPVAVGLVGALLIGGGGAVWAGVTMRDRGQDAAARNADATPSADAPGPSLEPAPGADPAPSTSSVPSGSGAAGSAPPSAADQRTAVANIADAFSAQLFVGPDRATCIAERWVGSVGLDALVSAGFLDAELTFYDQDLSTVDPRLKTALGAATTACLG